MYVLRLLRTGTRERPTGMVVVSFLAGAGNALLIGMINQAAEQAVLTGTVGLSSMLFYILGFAFFYVANRMALRESNRFVQHCLGALRLRVVTKIQRSPLRLLEQVGQGELFAAVAQETEYLSQNLPLFVSAMQSGFLLLFCLLYIAFLSPPSFVVLGAFTLAGLAVFWRGRMVLNRELAAVYGYEAAMLDGMIGFTKGFQEIRLNADKNDALYRRFTELAEALERSIVGVSGRWVSLLGFSNAFLYAMVGVVIFVLPLFFNGYTDVIYKIAAAAIFCVGPVTAITSATHLYAKADIGLGHIYRIAELLDEGSAGSSAAPAGPPFEGFARIDYRGVTFTYRDAAGQPLFTSGPWDFSLRRGEIVFFLGGNGSGKSTAMKLICGLYAPEDGEIRIDGVTLTPASRQRFRDLFCAIFPDFHLFDRLYGLGDIAPGRVRALIERMELSDKVTFQDGRFSTLGLSTGQRKRLALIAALLEDRDIYLFDEWAADQDPHFRDFFYNEILPDLRHRGKTVVAVTHDDRYWSCCDRQVRLDLGLMQTGPFEPGPQD